MFGYNIGPIIKVGQIATYLIPSFFSKYFLASYSYSVLAAPYQLLLDFYSLESDQCFSDLIFGGGLGDIADIDEVRTKVFIVSSVFSKEKSPRVRDAMIHFRIRTRI